MEAFAGEAMYAVVEDLRSGMTGTLCLSLLTLGDETAREQVRARPTITIGGCPKLCARVNVEASGDNLAASFRVVDTYRRVRQLKPVSVAMPDEAGRWPARLPRRWPPWSTGCAAAAPERRPGPPARRCSHAIEG